MDTFILNHPFNFYKLTISQRATWEKPYTFPLLFALHITVISRFNQIICYFQILYSLENITILKLCNLMHMPQCYFSLKPAENNGSLHRDRPTLPISALAQNENSYYTFIFCFSNVCKQCYKVTELNISGVTLHSMMAQKYQNRCQQVKS